MLRAVRVAAQPALSLLDSVMALAGLAVTTVAVDSVRVATSKTVQQRALTHPETMRAPTRRLSAKARSGPLPSTST